MILDKLKDVQVVLGSQSPRRRELLAALGISFEVIVREVDERFDSDIQVQHVALEIARKKSAAFLEEHFFEALVITADTIVIDAEGNPIGKPNDQDDAIRILRRLSGKPHVVHTAVVIRYRAKQHHFTEETKVWFAALSDDEIAYYVNLYHPYDKAGAYGIQEWIGRAAVTKIEGSYENVVGLPTARLFQELKEILK